MTTKELIAVLQQYEATVGANGPNADKDVIIETPEGFFYLGSVETNAPQTVVIVKTGSRSAYGMRH